LKGMHLMAMTANHLIMEGTTKSWFLKDDTDEENLQPENVKNFKYRVHYGVGSREHHQARTSHACFLNGTIHVPMVIPAVLQSLVSCSDFPSAHQDQNVRCEHWNMLTDEVIRKYAPWSTPSSERVAVAAKDTKLCQDGSWNLVVISQKSSFRPWGLQAIQVVEAEHDKVYIEHQHDLAHRFDHCAVQLYDARENTVGPISPFWMLRSPRSGQWRYVIGRVVGRTLAGTESFTVEDVWSDSTVGDLLDSVSMSIDSTAFSVVSHGTNSEVLPWSEVLLNNYPDPEIAQDGVSELTVTVVAQEYKEHGLPLEDHREGHVISLFFGLISFRK